MSYRFVPAATADVSAMVAWYDAQRAGTGGRMANEVTRFARRIGRFPQLYGRVRRPPRGRDVRQGTLHRFPVNVTYEVTATEVIILSVVHARRRRDPWRGRL